MSNIPVNFRLDKPENWGDTKILIEKALRQVEKDFALQGIPLLLKSKEQNYRDLVETLAQEIVSLDLINSGKLARVLYQIDLPERDIRQVLQDAPPDQIHFVLADRILKRCFQKVVIRENFKR